MADQGDAPGRITVSVREFIERILDERDRLYVERDRLYDIRFRASETAVSAALAAQEKQTASAFAASDKAISKAEEAQKDYNARSNEFRGQLDDQAKTLMPRTETQTMFNGVNSRVDEMKAALDREISGVKDDVIALREYRSEGSGRRLSTEMTWMVGIGAVTVLLALAALVVSILK